MISAINSVNTNPAFGNKGHVISVLTPNSKDVTTAAKEVVDFFAKNGKEVEFVRKSPFVVPEKFAVNSCYLDFKYPAKVIENADRDLFSKLGQVFVAKA